MENKEELKINVSGVVDDKDLVENLKKALDEGNVTKEFVVLDLLLAEVIGTTKKVSELETILENDLQREQAEKISELRKNIASSFINQKDYLEELRAITKNETTEFLSNFLNIIADQIEENNNRFVKITGVDE